MTATWLGYSITFCCGAMVGIILSLLAVKSTLDDLRGEALAVRAKMRANRQYADFAERERVEGLG